MSLLAHLGQALDALSGPPLAVVVLQRVDQLPQQPGGQVDPRDHHARDLVVLDLVVHAGEGDAELVVRVRDVREVRVVPGHDLRGGLEVDVALAVVLGHPAVVSRKCGTSCSRSGGCGPRSPTTSSTTASCWATTRGSRWPRSATTSSTTASCWGTTRGSRWPRSATTSSSSAGSPSATTSCCSTARARLTTRRASRASSSSAGRAAATSASWSAVRSGPASSATTTGSRSAP